MSKHVAYLAISTGWGGATTSLALMLEAVSPRFEKTLLLTACEPGPMRWGWARSWSAVR